MQTTATHRETSQAIAIILNRLHALAERPGPPGQSPQDIRAILAAVRTGERERVLSVLETLRQRAKSQGEDGLARGAELLSEAARQIWSEEPER